MIAIRGGSFPSRAIHPVCLAEPMRKALLIASVASLVATPVYAQASDSTPRDHRGVIAAQLEHATRAQGEQGYKLQETIDPQSLIGLLPNGGTVAVEISLRAGVQYFVSAVCDTDCEDLDLRVHAPGDDAPLAQDIEDDDVPLAVFTAKRSGVHLLTLKMADCNTEFCYFGFRVLAK